MPTVPGTLAYRIRAKYPGAYDDLDDAALESAIDAKHPGAYDDIPRSTLPTRPVSAEDFAPPQPSRSWPAKIGDIATGLARNTIGAIPETARAIYDAQRGTFGGDIDAATRTQQRLGTMASAQINEAKKAKQLYDEGRLSEARGHAAAAVVPLVGPMAAQAGEKIGAGDWEGVGEGIGLLAPFGAAEVVRAGAIPAAGRAATATGRGAMTVAKVAAPHVATVAADAALHAVGLPPIATATRFAKILSDVLDARKAKSAAEPVVSSPNVGGRVVAAQEPTLTKSLADAIAEARQPAPPVRITTPPAPDLPAGYTPRATVPKPKVAKMPAAAQAAKDAAEAPRQRAYFLKSPETMAEETAAAAEMPSTGKRAYFLKPVEQIAAEAEGRAAPAITPSGSINIEDLPASWKSRAGQDIFPTTGAEGKEILDAFKQQLQERGMTIGEAMALVSKNRDLPTAVRSQLMRALGKVKAK